MGWVRQTLEKTGTRRTPSLLQRSGFVNVHSSRPNGCQFSSCLRSVFGRCRMRLFGQRKKTNTMSEQTETATSSPERSEAVRNTTCYQPTTNASDFVATTCDSMCDLVNLNVSRNPPRRDKGGEGERSNRGQGRREACGG